MEKIKFRSAGFEEPQSYVKKHQGRINEDKRIAGLRGDHQWRMN